MKREKHKTSELKKITIKIKRSVRETYSQSELNGNLSNAQLRKKPLLF